MNTIAIVRSSRSTTICSRQRRQRADAIAHRRHAINYRTHTKPAHRRRRRRAAAFPAAAQRRQHRAARADVFGPTGSINSRGCSTTSTPTRCSARTVGAGPMTYRTSGRHLSRVTRISAWRLSTITTNASPISCARSAKSRRNKCAWRRRSNSNWKSEMPSITITAAASLSQRHAQSMALIKCHEPRRHVKLQQHQQHKP